MMPRQAQWLEFCARVCGEPIQSLERVHFSNSPHAKFPKFEDLRVRSVSFQRATWSMPSGGLLQCRPILWLAPFRAIRECEIFDERGE